MYALALPTLAVLLIAVAPRVMARQTRFRRAPRAALVAWQAVALAGLLSALVAAPVAVLEITSHGAVTGPPAGLVGVAVAVSGLVLVSLLVNGHLVGTRLRAARRRHRVLLDLVGREERATDVRYRVVPHETPTAYCVPGLRGHVVLTDGTLNRLKKDELTAVLAHERAHLAQRHDLVLELFTVLHSAAPRPIRAPQAMREVRLLIEVLADRAARNTVGEVPLARALVTLADGTTPLATLGARGYSRAITPKQPRGAAPREASHTLARMHLLTQPAASARLEALVYLFSAGVLAAPITLIILTLAAQDL